MKNKVLYVVMIIVILLGSVMLAVKGFNQGLLYSNHKRIEIVIGSEYNLDEIKNIVKDTIKAKAIVRKTTLFETSVAIDAKEMSDEEILNLFAKLNEKFGKDYDIKDLRKNDILTEMNVNDIASMSDEEITSLISQIKDKHNLEYTKEDLQDSVTLVRLTDIHEANMWDTLKYLVVPVLVSLGLVAVYFGIRFRKLYKNAWILEPIRFVIRMVLVEAFIVSVFAIARIPVAQYMTTVLILVWLLGIILSTVCEENRLVKGNSEE